MRNSEGLGHPSLVTGEEEEDIEEVEGALAKQYG